MKNATEFADEAGLIEDSLRVLLRSPGVLAPVRLEADRPAMGRAQWASPLTVRSAVTGREYMLEVRAVECSDWQAP